MDHSETPENDDFRDREFDCFLEKKKATGKGRGGGVTLDWEIKRETFLFIQLLTVLTAHTWWLLLYIVTHRNDCAITLVYTHSHG